jgi:hypothetical protein
MNLMLFNKETHIVKRRFKNLVILCLMSGIIIRSIDSQIPSNISYQTLNKITSLPVGKMNPAYNLLNTYSLSFQSNYLPIWTGILKKSDFTFNTTGNHFYDLILTPTSLNIGSTRLTIKLNTMEGYFIKGTFRSDIESLTGNPYIDTISVFYYPLRRTNEKTLSDSRLYRIAGFVIPRMLLFNYPGASETIYYPPAYLQPNYPLQYK